MIKKRISLRNACLFLAACYCLFSCHTAENKGKDSLFLLTDPQQTGIRFQNNIVDTAGFNILDYLYYYNGGGVAIGDVNNDGWADVYFSSNQGSNKLYLNKGNWQFEDITEKAGVSGAGNWKTGVTMADVNGDGWLDIYLSEVGNYKSLKGRNELFINKGDGTFSEKAAEYGLDITGFNTQAVFFDYDRDGDLDVFIVNHSVHSTETYGDSSLRSRTNPFSGDRLFRNDRVNGKIFFTDVTAGSGIYNSVIGYGLNAMAADLDQDGWTDLYVSNDFHENDYYYHNNGNGTFTEINRQAFGHESRFSMGSDIADINNDGWPDIMTLDMLPSSEALLKTAMGDDPPDIYQFKHDLGYHHQFSRNCLQLNTGRGKKFTDIALYAGVAATDWSWSPLLADFDNDGIKDLFISNGIVRRPNDLDFLKFNSRTADMEPGRAADVRAILRMPEGKVSNVIYKGTDSLRFLDNTLQWGLDQVSLSNGAATADLDNDGDLDLVVNNINQPAFVYQNQSSKRNNNHWLEIKLEGDSNNRSGIGAKVWLLYRDQRQLLLNTGTKGFQSSSLHYLHAGLGADSVVSRVVVQWPDGSSQEVSPVRSNQLLTIRKDRSAKPVATDGLFAPVAPSLLDDISNSIGIPFIHKENIFSDFSVQPLIPHELSTRGPRIAVADINGDQLDDFFVGGSSAQAGQLFVQKADGRFISTNQSLFQLNWSSEDVDALFFDADHDGDQDLYVVSGGNQYSKGSPELQDRLYINDGKGNFVLSKNLPVITENKSCVAAADIDLDGDMDLFVAATAPQGKYGEMPSSYLLINENGKFTIAGTTQFGLAKPGMITGCAFIDYDQDHDPDLLLVGEWMSPVILENNKGRFDLPAKPIGQSGWWQSVLVTDINADGYPDFVAGNWGLNSKLYARPDAPLKMYEFDYDKNGTNELVVAYNRDGKYYPFLGKDEIEKQIPAIRKKYLQYHDFAGKTVEEAFGKPLAQARVFEAATLSSAIFINDRKGNFVADRLPFPSQLAPVFGLFAGDLNNDGKTDLLTGGNFSGVLPFEGNYDGSTPTLLLGNGKGQFSYHLQPEPALLIDGEVRDIKQIHLGKTRTALIISRNNAPLVILQQMTAVTEHPAAPKE